MPPPEDQWQLQDTPIFWFEQAAAPQSEFVGGPIHNYLDMSPQELIEIAILRFLQADMLRRGDVGGATDNG